MLRSHVPQFTLAALVALSFAFAGSSAIAQSADDYKGDPYTLGVCSVSGEALGSMGDPILLNHEGRDIRFCCAGCKPKFENNPAKALSKIDAMMVEAQKELYPFDTDVVSGAALGDAPVDVIHYNRLVRFSSQMSAQKFMKDSDKYIAMLDKAVIAKQLESYPIDKCVISGEALDVMGDPIQLVAANRLIQFCCTGCVETFWKSPHTAFQMLDAGKAGEGSDSKKKKDGEHAGHEGHDHDH